MAKTKTKQAAEAEREQFILGTIASGLRKFGYPKCTPENVLTDKIYAKFAKLQLQELIDDHPNATFAPTVQRLLERIVDE
jgi:hypothetical protein